MFFSACRKERQTDSPVIATAGKENLYISDIKAFLPSQPGLRISEIQVQNYIQRWTEKELIYQQAVAQGFAEGPEIQRKLREFERDYIFALYVQKNVDDRITVSDDELNAYYTEHNDEFVRQENYYDLQLILLGSLSAANECQSSLQLGDDFGTVARENSLDDSKGREGKIGWTNLTGLPDEVRMRIPALGVRQVSTPIQTEIGYYLVQVLGVRPRGEKQTLDEVRDLVTWKIKAYKREDEFKQLVDQLKETAGVTVNWSLLDSLKIE
jgi:parvulin-like peptidyl-prolyl isomerase